MLTGIAVEVREPSCRMLPLAEPVRDRSRFCCAGLPRAGEARLRPCSTQQPGRATGELLPAVTVSPHWPSGGCDRGSVEPAHLGYLNEFVFRFNRRRSRSRGMVF